MAVAFAHHKARDYSSALGAIDAVKATDWKIAGRQWLLRRKMSYEARGATP